MFMPKIADPSLIHSLDQKETTRSTLYSETWTPSPPPHPVNVSPSLSPPQSSSLLSPYPSHPSPFPPTQSPPIAPPQPNSLPLSQPSAHPPSQLSPLSPSPPFARPSPQPTPVPPSQSAPLEAECPTRRPSSKKRVQFKADPELVEVRPITPQSPRGLPRSRSAPSFAELSPCDPRQIEQAMERARVSDFILSLGCRPAVSIAGGDPYYRARPVGVSSANPAGRPLGWPAGVAEGAGSRGRPASGSQNALPRFYAATPGAGLARASNSSGLPAGSTAVVNSRPVSANYSRLGFYRKLPVSAGASVPVPAGPSGANSRRLDVGNTSPFITVRRLTSSSSTPAGKASATLQRSSGGATEDNGHARSVTLARLSELGLGSTV